MSGDCSKTSIVALEETPYKLKLNKVNWSNKLNSSKKIKITSIVNIKKEHNCIKLGMDI